MAARLSPIAALRTTLRAAVQSSPPVCRQPQVNRRFSACTSRLSNSDYDKLTAIRTSVPFIEAFRQAKAEREGKVSPEGPKEAPKIDMTPKRMSDSYHRVVLPLARDPWLLDNYINSSGHIRLGTLFMDLDALAGAVAYKHTGDGFATVTAAADRIMLKRPLTSISDLELSGQVTFATGRSSLEISMQVAKAPPPGQVVREEDVLITCAFTMVSLDPKTRKPVPVSPLKTETPEEQRLFEQGQINYNLKKSLAKKALRKQTPNDEESDLIHAFWLKQLDYDDPNTSVQKSDNVLYMDSTKIHSVQIMQPQYRNRHNFMIFGGFLLKTTFELAFTCASAVSHARPTFIALDPSTFDNPVPVGSVLYLTAQVAYTDSPVVSSGDVKASPSGSTRIQVRVDSRIRNVEHGETKPTGVFNYTFEVPKDVKIVPQSYSQFMVYLDARRRSMQAATLVHEPLGTGAGMKTESVMG